MPSWLPKLELDTGLKVVRRRLFDNSDAGLEWRRIDFGSGRIGSPVDRPERNQTWDQFLKLAAAERATLEMLDAIGVDVGFHSADRLFEGLANLRTGLLERLLKACTSVKTERLFFFFADRHAHGWAKRLDAAEVDLGTGIGRASSSFVASEHRLPRFRACMSPISTFVLLAAESPGIPVQRTDELLPRNWRKDAGPLS